MQGACALTRLMFCTKAYFALMCLWTVAAPGLCNYGPEDHTVGVNYGLLGDNLPASADAVKIITNLGIGRVRLFNPDATTLSALGGSGLQVVVGMGNDVIPSLAANVASADSWVVQNIVPYPTTNITTILLGNELFADTSLSATWPQLVPAMKNLQTSLASRNLSSIKLSTAAELNTLSWSYPPSKGVFRSDIAASVLTPFFQFLNDTGSYFFLNVYPYFGWRDDSAYIPMDYALFTRTTPFVVDGNYSYYNLLDAQLDAVAAAMERLGFGNVRLAISETGWPTLGAAGSVGTNFSNAETYNTNLLKYVLNVPTRGTPRRPGVFIPTYLFALFNEDLKTGGVAEQNWGILYPNGTQVYPLQLRMSSSATTNMTQATASPTPTSTPNPVPASANPVTPTPASESIAPQGSSAGPIAPPSASGTNTRCRSGGFSVNFLTLIVAVLCLRHYLT